MVEKTRHREAFELYWRMGGACTLEQLHAELEADGRAPNLRTIYEWSRLHHWQHQIAAMEQEAKQAEHEARIAALKEMYERQAKEALLLQQKGAEWLAAMGADDATADAAIRAVVEGAKLERLARGEPTDRQEVNGEIGINARLAGLSDEELDRLLEYTEGALDGEGQKEPR